METATHQIKTTWYNKIENCIIGEESIDIDDTIIDNMSDLYKSGLREFGRCTSKIYIDLPDGTVKHTGYTFEKRAKYDDCNKYYLQETWLTIEQYTETRQYS